MATWGNNYIWTSSSNATTWDFYPVQAVSTPKPKRTAVDWLADEVDAVCALTREAA